MVALADIMRTAGSEYLELHRNHLLPSHRRAIADILSCRTPALGGQLYRCPDCNEVWAVYFSCRNRHCTQCQVIHADAWLDRQRQLLLTTPYLLVTCTLPSQLRALAYSRQRLIYSILMRTAAQALLDVVADPRFIGGRAAILAVLHTWTRAMQYHPHVHMLLPAGGLDTARDQPLWRMPRNKAFPIPSFALAHRFRQRMRDALVNARLTSGAEPVFARRWVANVIKVGSGDTALLYLSRYVFRTAITDDRITALDGDQVSFHWRESASGKRRVETLPAHAFIGRFLQHVLPRGFTRVRYYGLWAPTCRRQLDTARDILEHRNHALGMHATKPGETNALIFHPRCPTCGAVHQMPLCRLPRQRGPP